MDEEMDGDEDEMDDGPDVVIGDAELMDDDQWDVRKFIWTALISG